MRKKGLWILGLLLILVVLPASAAMADAPVLHMDGGQIFVDEDVSLEVGESFDGDLGVFNGDLMLPHGSVVNGDVFVANGDVDVEGQINGSLSVLNGDLMIAPNGVVEGEAFGMNGEHEVAGRVQGNLSSMFGELALQPSAIIAGDLMVMSGSLDRQPGAQVLGEEMPDVRLPNMPLLRKEPQMRHLPEIREIPQEPNVPRVVPFDPSQPHRDSFGARVGRFVGRAVSTTFASLLAIILGLLVVFFWPRPTGRVSECIANLPLQSFGLGLLTFLLAAVLEALAAVLMILVILVAAALISTVILIPIGLLLILLSVLLLLPVPLALMGAMGLGWVALAHRIGYKVLDALGGSEAKPLGTTLVGLLITVFTTALIGLVSPACCLGPFVVLLSSIGVGAAIHTRFGRQSCQVPPAAQTVADSNPVLPAAEAIDNAVLPAEAMDDEIGLPDEPPSGES